MPSPPPPPTPFEAPRARFVLLLAARRAEILDPLARRFELESGLESAPLDWTLDNDRAARWLALAPLADPARLPGLQGHARRVAGLHGVEADSPAAEIQAGYVDGRRVVRAALEDGPARLYLGEGVWGEIIAEAEAGELKFSAAPSPWNSGASRGFLDAAWRSFR